MRRAAPGFEVEVETAEGPRVFSSRSDLPGARLLAFRFVDSERKADRLSLTIDNEDLRHFDDPLWRRGQLLRVRWGYAGRLSPTHEVTVTKVTGGRTLTVEARGPAAKLNRVRRSRLWENVTVEQLARAIAEEHGIEAARVFVDDAARVISAAQQARETDAQFLRRLADEMGFEFYVDRTGLHFRRRRLDAPPVRRFVWRTDEEGEVLDFDVEVDVTARPSRVRARGRDPLEGRDVEAVAEATAADEPAPSSGGEGGSIRIVRDRLTGRLELAPPPGSERDDAERAATHEEVVPVPGGTEGEAAKAAARVARRALGGSVKMELVVVGDPTLEAKAPVQLEGFGRRLSIRYWAREVEHVFSGEGYRTRLKLISDGSGGLRRRSEAAGAAPDGAELAQAAGAINRGEAPSRERPPEGAAPRALAGVVVKRDERTGELRFRFVRTEREAATRRAGGGGR